MNLVTKLEQAFSYDSAFGAPRVNLPMRLTQAVWISSELTKLGLVIWKCITRLNGVQILPELMARIVSGRVIVVSRFVAETASETHKASDCITR